MVNGLIHIKIRLRFLGNNAHGRDVKVSNNSLDQEHENMIQLLIY